MKILSHLRVLGKIMRTKEEEDMTAATEAKLPMPTSDDDSDNEENV